MSLGAMKYTMLLEKAFSAKALALPRPAPQASTMIRRRCLRVIV
jgi:hypothetical protein